MFNKEAHPRVDRTSVKVLVLQSDIALDEFGIPRLSVPSGKDLFFRLSDGRKAELTCRPIPPVKFKWYTLNIVNQSGTTPEGKTYRIYDSYSFYANGDIEKDNSVEEEVNMRDDYEIPTDEQLESWREKFFEQRDAEAALGLHEVSLDEVAKFCIDLRELNRDSIISEEEFFSHE